MLDHDFGVDMDLLHKHALGGLDIEADPEDEEFMYLAAFEEAAAQCEALVVFLDGGHVQASIPSWRLDVVPVRSVVLHAKVTLLAWANHVRIVVGSHNMTNDGYRHNREHMGVLDFHSEACHHALLNECLAGLKSFQTPMPLNRFPVDKEPVDSGSSGHVFMDSRGIPYGPCH